MNQILIVEDDLALAAGLCRALATEENRTVSCGSIKEARNRFETETYDLLLLDVNLPDGSGFDFLQEIRSQSQVPVILLTANDLETDIVSGLEMGADDYITKPFSLAVLRARVHTQLRKKETVDASETVCLDIYQFNFRKMEFFRKEEKIELSKTEQRLLRLLVENQGQTLSREFLVDRIWTDGAEFVEENALSVSVKRLRDKLNAQEYIKTVYGIGYTWRTKNCDGT